MHCMFSLCISLPYLVEQIRKQERKRNNSFISSGTVIKWRPFLVSSLLLFFLFVCLLVLALHICLCSLFIHQRKKKKNWFQSLSSTHLCLFVFLFRYEQKQRRMFTKKTTLVSCFRQLKKKKTSWWFKLLLASCHYQLRTYQCEKSRIKIMCFVYW